jgi:hypothetical protein
LFRAGAEILRRINTQQITVDSLPHVINHVILARTPRKGAEDQEQAGKPLK